jgi:hypothetical protein
LFPDAVDAAEAVLPPVDEKNEPERLGKDDPFDALPGGCCGGAEDELDNGVLPLGEGPDPPPPKNLGTPSILCFSPPLRDELLDELCVPDEVAGEVMGGDPISVYCVSTRSGA